MALYQQLLERVNAIPGVRAASMSRFGLIGAGYSGRNVSVPGYMQSGRDRSVAINIVGPRFFETNGIAMTAGREFSSGDHAAAPRVVIVNEKFARFYFGADNPIGKRLAFSNRLDQQLEIVGLVHDAKYFLLRRETPRMVFVPFMQSPLGLDRMYVEVRTAANLVALAATVRREIQSIARDVPIAAIRTQEQQLDTVLIQERLLATISGFFSLLALVLTCIGLYGIMSYSVARRTNEIGVRVALGAAYHDVLWLILRDSVVLLVIGVAVGLIGAQASTRLIAKILFGLQPNDPVTIAEGVLLLFAVAIFAGWLPAGRAARVDPMNALRYE